MSKENNFPELAYKTVVDELLEKNKNEKDIQIGVASRYEPSKVIDLEA